MGWSINDLKRDFEILINKYKEAGSHTEREIIIKNMAELATTIMVFEINEHNKVPITSSTEEYEEKMEENQSYAAELALYIRRSIEYMPYFPFLYAFKRGVKELDIVDTIDCKEVKDTLSLSDLEELVHDFYKQTTSEIYKYYLMQDFKNINFDEKMCVDEGHTYPAYGLGRSYMTIGTKGDKRRALHTLVHETGHIIGQFINEDRVLELDNFNEIEALFFEMIGEDYFAKQLKDNTFNCYQLERMLLFYKQNYKLIRCEEVALKTFNDMNSKKSPLILFDKYSAGENLHFIEYSKYMRYIVSYLVALELREVYMKDKELAFNMLKQICSRDYEKTEYERITDVVTPCKSLTRVKKRIYRASKNDIVNIQMKNTDN